MQDQNMQPLPWSIKYIAGILAAIELLLQAGDIGLLPGGSLRHGAMEYGALWPGLVFDGVKPMFAGQPVVMLLSYAFLHVGLLHMALNTVVILGLGKRLGAVLGNGQLLLVFGVTAVAGGLAYLALSTSGAPVVGASGAVFGFFGVWKYLEYSARRRMGLSLMPIWQFIGALVLLNVGLWFLADGLLAWQAHLGGFVAGWALGIVFVRRGGQASRASRR